MTIVEAVNYCENHECEVCPIYTNNLDKRTEKDRAIGHVMCCENLLQYELSDKIFNQTC